jgi:predicted phosphodiesterase
MEYRPRLNEGQNDIIMAAKGHSDIKSYLVLGCVHVPFQNRIIMDGIHKMMQAYDFDGVVLNGDFLDMGSLSDYEKGKVNKTGITLEEEYEEANIELDILDSLLKNDSKKVYLFGNHENRYHRWKSDVNNSKYGNLMEPVEALKLKDRGYKVFENYQDDHYELGSLQVFHGFYYNVHSAKKHLDVFRRNVLYNHTHRVQMYREGDFCAWNAGYLGNVNAPCFDYASRAMKSAWANAFAIVHLDKDRHYVDIVNCVNNSFVYNGVKYGA